MKAFESKLAIDRTHTKLRNGGDAQSAPPEGAAHYRRNTMSDLGEPERRVVVVPKEKPVTPVKTPVKTPEREPA